MDSERKMIQVKKGRPIVSGERSRYRILSSYSVQSPVESLETRLQPSSSVTEEWMWKAM